MIQSVLEKLKELAIADIKRNRPNVQDNIKNVVTVLLNMGRIIKKYYNGNVY